MTGFMYALLVGMSTIFVGTAMQSAAIAFIGVGICTAAIMCRSRDRS